MSPGHDADKYGRPLTGNSKSELDTMAIVEVKKRIRDRASQQILMQEACEVCGWLMKTSADMTIFNGHFLLVSQNRHEIYITFAQYKRSLEDYLNRGIQTDEFLVMETYGPWFAEDAESLRHFAQVIVTAVLIAKAARLSRQSMPPPPGAR
ncbi:hypothetical protein BO94DRAFT_584191 [Aspergillus sclerotioniger CBS 115572]|uniref:Uncharacterized protein n=1 Tax=Aspergillus sclerotioniger CBS 115572 TaxID=1450535 RepID=A0A317X087_9EURO|nr:hypothetical protein BO94DRAFT_584191 [Aspergillus sclerotioniger CBS 115572]PWY91581.1 hypothetical protein BO94DRAFT_584191 [Aspergillus sclerotioniger CBS 115572]